MSDRSVRIVAVSASLLLHAALLLQFGGATGADAPSSETASPTRLTFVQPAPTPESVPERMAQPTPERTPPKPVPETLRETARKIRKPEQQKPVEPQPSPAQLASAAPSATATPQLDEGVVASETERYLAEVMAHVERHKHYPKAARRRGIQGEVQVRFTLYPDGTAHAIEVSDGPSLLVAAAQRTVEKAVPLPSPPPSIHCPLKCQFRIRFALDAS